MCIRDSAHLDHVDAFRYLMDCHPGDFSLEKLYYCFPSQPYLDAYEPEEAHTLREMTELMGKMAPDTLRRVEGGERIYVGGLRFTCLLYTSPARVQPDRYRDVLCG